MGEKLTIEEMLIACRYVESPCIELMHRMIHRFNLFIQKLINNKEGLIKIFEITDKDLIKRINDFSYDGIHTLYKEVKLFYDCYLSIHEENEQELIKYIKERM